MLFGLNHFTPKTLIQGGKPHIWAPLRKKFIPLTAEEWVRQHLIQHLIQDHHYPAPLLTEEHSFYYNKQLKRADLLCYSPKRKTPLLLVECKALEIRLGPKQIDQLITYNHIIQAHQLLLTNGIEQINLTYDGSRYKQVNQIPAFTPSY